MLRNKIAMILVIVITGVFASLYGGPVTRGLFYLSFIIPIVSFLYAVYVYFSFSPIQQVKPQIVVKGKKARYSLRLVNNSIFPYTNVKWSIIQINKILKIKRFLIVIALSQRKSILLNQIFVQKQGTLHHWN